MKAMFQIGDLFQPDNGSKLNSASQIPVWKHIYKRHWSDAIGFLPLNHVGVILDVWCFTGSTGTWIEWKYKIFSNGITGWVDESNMKEVTIIT